MPFHNMAQTFNYTGPMPIPDYGPEVCASINVSGLPTTINSTFGLSGVCFDITHPYDSDLEIRLKSPNGNSIFICGYIGGNGDNFTNTCVAENGTSGYIIHGSSPFTGVYIPLESLNLLNNGQDPNGTWLFCVKDVSASDSGLVNSASLTFSNNPPPDPGPPPPLCNFCTCPNGSATCDLLPDMTASALAISKDIDTITHISNFELPGLINFDNSTPNIGWGPLETIGVDSCFCGTTQIPCTSTTTCPNGDPVKQIVHQVIYQKQANNDTLLTYERTASYMSYHPTHGHIHLDHWADFTLRRATSNPNPLSWPIVGNGTKTSYCLINLGDCDSFDGYCKDTNGTTLNLADIPNAGLGYYSGCNLHQGIYVGSLDIYSVGLNSGIDLTGVCNGDYYILSITDPNNDILETNENNNWVAVPVTLTQQMASPSANFSLSLTGNTVGLNANNLTNATSFEWNFGDGVTDTINNPALHSYSANGTYYITLTVNSPCGTFTKTDSVTITTIGVADINNENEYFLKAQPNPAKGITEISFFVLNPNENISVELYNAFGQRVNSFFNSRMPVGKHSLVLDFKEQNLSSGTYFIKLLHGEKSLMQRVISLN